jgi:hypothetical protein
VRNKTHVSVPIPAPPEWWPKALIDERRASELLDVPVVTLRDWRCRRTRDLPFVKLGASVKYNPVDVWAWLCRNTVRGDEIRFDEAEIERLVCSSEAVHDVPLARSKGADLD